MVDGRLTDGGRLQPASVLTRFVQVILGGVMQKPLSRHKVADPRDPIASAVRTLETEAAGITILSAAIHGRLGRAFTAAVELIAGARGRLIVTGMGKSGHIGRKIAATFASTGTPAFFVHPSEASHGDLGMIASDDVIMALSWSGETSELKNLIDYSRRFRIRLIAVTTAADSTLGRSADIVLALPQAREACPHNLAPTTSTLMQSALGDALAVALLESRGFTALDFGRCIPAGDSAPCSNSSATSCMPGAKSRWFRSAARCRRRSRR